MAIRTGYLLRFLLGSSSSLICWVADNNISDDSFLCLFSVHSPADTDRVCTSLSLVFPTIIIVWSVSILLITSILNQMFIVSVNIAFYLEQRIWSDMYMPSSMEHLTQWHVLVAISIPYRMWFKGFIYFIVITDDAVGEHGCRTWESTRFVLLRWLQKNDIHMLQF
jgi:hypothetical protein